MRARSLSLRACFALAVQKEESLAIGLLGFFGFLSEGLLRLFSLRNVASHLRRTDHTPIGILDGRYRHRDIELPSVFGEANGFEMIDAFAAPNAGEDLLFLRLAIRRNQSHD